MRVFALIALLFATFAPGQAAAQATAEPMRLVKSFYARDYDEEKMPLSAPLRKLHGCVVALSNKRDEPLAGLNFVWTLGAQDAEEGWEKTLGFKELDRAQGRATIQATFRNGDPQEIRYHMIREKGRWVVDDIQYLTGEKTTLSALFRLGLKGES
jgi:hypothetical protein